MTRSRLLRLLVTLPIAIVLGFLRMSHGSDHEYRQQFRDSLEVARVPTQTMIAKLAAGKTPSVAEFTSVANAQQTSADQIEALDAPTKAEKAQASMVKALRDLAAADRALAATPGNTKALKQLRAAGLEVEQAQDAYTAAGYEFEKG